MKVAAFIAIALCLCVANAEIHAVLLAGSNGFWNYRHQADVCHAYHTLINHGVKAENIITMAYDDIANDSENPFPGKVFNQPNGKDVYEGCVIDYKGENVTADKYIAVLTGDAKTAGGRVLQSTENDTVFINFADHGGTGLIAVIDDYLYADTLVKALTTMHTKKMYNKLVYYMEACESGSMFTNLPNNLNIFAETAANAEESSWGFYCPPDDVVNGKEIGSCLGDTWSISWMEDSDANDLTQESIDDQFNAILKRVNQSHPQKFGDLTIKDDKLSNYQGSKKEQTSWLNWILGFFTSSKVRKSTQVDSRLGKLAYHKAKYDRTQTLHSFKGYTSEAESIKNFDKTFEKIDEMFSRQKSLYETSVKLPADLSCLRHAVSAFESSCYKFTDYGLKYTKNLAHLCYSFHFYDFDTLFRSVCTRDSVLLE